MIRALFTLCFTLATLIGPGLCCCAFATPSQPKQAKKAEPAAGHCPHCRTKAPEKQAPAQPSPAKNECPCKQKPDRCQVASAAAITTASNNFDRLLLDDAGVLMVAVLPAEGYAVCTSPLRIVPDVPPFLDTDDFLFAFHILRC